MDVALDISNKLKLQSSRVLLQLIRQVAAPEVGPPVLISEALNFWVVLSCQDLVPVTEGGALFLSALPCGSQISTTTPSGMLKEIPPPLLHNCFAGLCLNLVLLPVKLRLPNYPQALH